ncbi:hypothetical protein [Streptomyces roseochromogenus]|uniref:Uncharacterized protein n=1 Tax=Streptomyces roseochromogenus subsp. oscitans DS 12.976 TaxID=1352936 RepID=V6JDY5_STRRC|nr:hypothetical protein [Streptomyces roseochromogenus]EST18045.1 hypothetical protein M878_46105 [Streptomyces roseochromogenus subsp. oscitans DS 12.976]
MMASRPSSGVSDLEILEGLRRVVDAQIGPRREGAIYTNQDGAFQVLAVVRDPQRARELLNRRCAQWALIVKDLLQPGAFPFAIGSVWTTSDRLVLETGDAPSNATDGGTR